jgi:diguanylate cyclase (GGDEF)-like protein
VGEPDFQESVVRKASSPGLSLLAKFGVISIIPVILSTIILGRSLDGIVRRRTTSVIREQAVMLTALRLQPFLNGESMTKDLPAKAGRELNSILSKPPLDGIVSGINIFNSSGRNLYANDPEGIEPTSPTDSQMDLVLTGRVVADDKPVVATKAKGDASYLDVLVPLEVNGRAVGIIQVYLPFDPIADLIGRDNHQLYLILLCGFTLFYAILFRLVARASSKLQRQAAENEYQAMHDSLTELPNRALFLERANQALLTARREGWSFAVMIMDLDRFKEINDTLGHQHGDQVLQQIGGRLEPLLRESDTVARLGGDEFAILFPHVEDPASVMRIAQKMRNSLERPFYVQGLALDVDASIGIAVYPRHGKDINTLLQRADVAMYVAKNAGTGQETYASENDNHSPYRLSLSGDLRNAIEREELLLMYQPQVSLSDGSVRGVEALVRWQHPDRGILGPGEFIPIAERGGLIQPLTRYVLNAAIRQCAEWDREGLNLNVAVNLSVRNLLDPELSGEVREVLEKWDIDPIRLELEITESSIMSDPERAAIVLNELHALGVRLAVDDFGTGYSSLSSLKKLPISAIKIDRSFIQHMAVDENDLFIVRSVIDLSHNLGVEVVGEGVETKEVSDMLALLGCDFAQGFYRSAPTHAKEIPWLVGVMHPIGSPAPPPPPPPPALAGSTSASASASESEFPPLPPPSDTPFLDFIND